MNPTCRRRKRRARRKLCSVYLLPLHLAIAVLCCCCSSQAMAVENKSLGAEMHSSNATSGQQFKREVMRGGDGELLDIPYPAQKFQHIWSSKEELPVLLGRHVGSSPSAPPKISSNGSRVEKARVVAGIIESNPLLKSLNMFQSDEGDAFVDITSPNLLKPLDSSEQSDVGPAKKYSSSLPLKRSVLKKKFSVGVDKAVLGAKLGSDAAVAKAYAILTESRTQNGVVDNFDEIYQIFNATMFHQAKAVVTENLKQPYPPFPPPRMDVVVPPAALTTSTPTFTITDYMKSLVSSLTSSNPNFTTKVMADDVVASSTPFDHALFDQESSKLAVTTTASSSPNRGTTLPVLTTSRTIRKQSSTKKTLHSSGATTSVPFKKNAGSASSDERVVSSTPTQYNPTTAAGKFHKELEGITHPHWNIDMNNYTEQQPFEVTESLELALSTAPPTSTTTIQVNNESTNEWWLQSSSSAPATSDPPTTGQPLSRSSLVMMQQEEYPKDELSYSKKQLYPWERQRELLVPFSSTKSSQSDPLQKQVTFADKNLQQEKSGKSEEHLSTLQPFPPIMPGASFYVDQHVSHGHYGREPASNGHSAVVYDPNVLQSRYGFSGMLPQSGASVIAPLTAFKKNRKPTTFGVQNLPIVGAGEAPLTSKNQQMVDASNAVFFFIPLPRRLSTAKAIKVRAQANSTFVGENLPIPQLPFLTSATKSPQQFPTLVHQWEDLSSPTTHPSTTAAIPDKRRTMSMEFNSNHLNWRPLGSGPKKLGPAKLVPLPSLIESNSVAEGSAPGKEQSFGLKLEVESYDDFKPATSNNCSS